MYQYSYEPQMANYTDILAMNMKKDMFTKKFVIRFNGLSTCSVHRFPLNLLKNMFVNIILCHFCSCCHHALSWTLPHYHWIVDDEHLYFAPNPPPPHPVSFSSLSPSFVSSCSRPGAPVNLAGTYRGQYNMGPLSPHSDPYYVYADGARGGMTASFN